jgi:hypothetical protein
MERKRRIALEGTTATPPRPKRMLPALDEYGAEVHTES